MLGLVSSSSSPGPSTRAVMVQFGAERSGFGGRDGLEPTLAMRCLGAEIYETLPPVPGDLLIGAEFVEFDRRLDRLEAATEDVYRRIIRQASAGALCRIWNYVPRINDSTAGLENYRAFCRGRGRAFEAEWGSDFKRRLPAASAVGGPADVLAVFYALSPSAAVPVENPEQVPAYEYPREHGPQSPSFCRATRTAGLTHDWVFVSGTAAIKGHRSVAVGELLPQIDSTLDNLRLISNACQIGPDLGLGRGWRRAFKIYLRRAQDWAAANAALQRTLLRPDDTVIWLEADICRAELEIEIEATLWRPR
jgi:chorismate lyase / 3-hydroxybenzoate synthase